jgi:hypothetical protein
MPMEILLDCNAHQLLETAARIIAEDDTCIVLAVRIRKSLIAEHLPLLGALCDLTPARETAPKKRKKPASTPRDR